MLASIVYAKRIQDALLNAERSLDKHLPNHFLIYKPKDIVSGDFYWCREIDGKIYVAVADCTGHGVPGAFMSVLGITLLNEIIDTTSLESPSDILNELRLKLKKALYQNSWELENSDGIEMALIKHSPLEKKVQLAASYHTVMVYSNHEMIEIKGDRCPVGVCFGKEKLFSSFNVEIIHPTTFYMFSDGYADQMGGEENKKFYSRRLKKMIVENANKDFTEQKNILEDTLSKHMGNRTQTDDIILMGIQIS
jgi:serine phosphatase RsbU (regulator of sigma subunit)